MFLESKTFQFYSSDNAVVYFYYFGFSSIPHCLHEDEVFVYMYCHHDLSVALAGQVRKLYCLVGVGCLFQVYDFYKHIILFLQGLLGYTLGCW